MSTSTSHKKEIDFNPFDLVGKTVIHNGKEKKVRSVGGKMLSEQEGTTVRFQDGSKAPINEVKQK